MSEQWKKVKPYLNIINQHSGLLAIGISTITFLFAFLQAIYFAQGDTRLANLIINELGIVSIWTSGLISLTFALVLTLFSLLVAYTRGDLVKLVGWPIGILIWIFAWGILPIGVFIAIAIGITVGLIAAKIANKRGSRLRIKRQVFITMGITYAAFYLFTAVATFPLLPTSKIVTQNNDSRIVTVIDRNNESLLLVSQKPYKLEKMDSTQIKSETICREKRSWFSKPLSNLIVKDYGILPNC